MNCGLHQRALARKFLLALHRVLQVESFAKKEPINFNAMGIHQKENFFPEGMPNMPEEKLCTFTHAEPQWPDLETATFPSK